MLGALYAIARPSLCLLYWWIRQNAVEVRIVKFLPLWYSHIPLVFAAADFETVLLTIIRIGFDVMSDRLGFIYTYSRGYVFTPLTFEDTPWLYTASTPCSRVTM